MVRQAQPNPGQPINLQAAKAAAKNVFNHVHGVAGFGIGDGTVRIYVQNADVQRQLPDEILGVPIEFVVTGDIVARP